MKLYPWNLPNLRGDPMHSKAMIRGKQLFAMMPPHRPLIALVDYDLLAAATQRPQLHYLLQLLSEDIIEAYLYADDGPDSSARLHWFVDDSGKKVDAYKDWVEVRPASDDRRRIFAWFKEDKPFHRLKTLDDSAYERVATTKVLSESDALSDGDLRVEADALAMLAAKTIQADMFVTERQLPHSLGHDPWSRVTVLAPEEALPLVGLYLRSQGRCVITNVPILGRRHERASRQVRDKYEFYWHAAEAFLPEHYRWQAACRQSARSTGDDMLEVLQQTVVQRLKQALQSRDRLLVRLAVPQDWDTADDVLNELDQILLWIMGAFDATARVAHVALGLPDGDLQDAGWHREKWIRAVKRRDMALAALVTGTSEGKRIIEILTPLRNLIHSASLSTKPLILVIGPNALETWVAIPAADRMKVLNGMIALDGAKAWGVEYPLKRFGSQFPTTKDDPFLHPGIFVERLFPYAIRLLNDLMAAAPVDRLPGVSALGSRSSLSLPLTTSDERTIWQLAVGKV